MARNIITYTSRCLFLGRNGMYKQAGIIAVLSRNKCISLTPITCKGFPARCFVEVPIEDVDTLIDMLHNLKAEHRIKQLENERNTNQDS